MKVELTLTGATNPTVSITDLPYDKQKGFTFKKALGYASDYTVCFKILNGGVSHGVTYPGFTYTDGTGKLIKYKASTGICNEGRTENPILVNNAQLLEIANADWGIINHGYQHGDGIPLNDLHQNDVTLFQDIGYRCDAIQIPNADEGYVDTGVILGYKQVNSQFGNNASDGNNDVVPTNISWGGVVNLAANSPKNFDKILASQWLFDDNFPSSQIQPNKDLVDSMFENPPTNLLSNAPVGKWIGQTISHGPPETTEGATSFNAIFQYIKDHPQNNDTVWVCSTKEVLDYLDMRRNSGVIQSFNSTTNILTLEIDLSGINPDTFIRNLSFRLSSGTITNATIVNGLDEVTFNGNLLNLYKRDKSTYRNPNTLVLPPQIVSAQYLNNNVYLTYDKPVTQSLINGYEVSNRTVTNISGSGINWVISCNSSVSNSDLLYYRPHRGDAKLTGSSIEGMKVPSYIGIPLTTYVPPEPSDVIKMTFRIVDTPTPPTGTDQDPFLTTWDTGSRVSGNIPWQANDAYLEDNVHDVQGFDAWRDGSTDNFYNNGIKIQDNTLYPIRVSVRKYKAKVSGIRVFTRPASNFVSYYYIKKGEFTKNLIGTTPANSTGWVTLNLPQTEDVTWLIVEPQHKDDSINQLEIIGSYVEPTAVVPTVRKPMFKKTTWQNIFNWNVLENDGRDFTTAERIALLKQHAGVRHYLDRYHVEPFAGDYFFSPSWNEAGSWDLDDFYQLLFDNDIDVRACIKNFPTSFQQSWSPELRSSEQLPVEYQGSRDSTTEWAYQPEAYLAEGKLFFQFAARYGSTVVVDNLLSVHTEAGGVFPNNLKRTGLGLVSKMECTNEPDSWWHGWEGFSKARQLAARMSCVWDGHKGTLGNNVGVKQADPSMSLSMAGLGVATFEEIMSMLDWFREHRGYKENGQIDIPFDCINYHVYSNDGGSSQYGTATRGMPPETSGFADKMKYFVDLSDEYMYGMPVILGEYGYDISQFSKQRAVRIIDLGSETSDKSTRKLVQAQWTLRSMLLGWINGLHEVQAYLLDDVSDDEYNNYAQSGWNEYETLVRRPVGNFSYQVLQLLGEYEVEQVISTSPYVVKAVNTDDDIIYVLWSPTETASTGNYNLSLSGVTSVTRYDLSLSTITPTQTNITVSGGALSVPYSETPIFIKVN